MPRFACEIGKQWSHGTDTRERDTRPHPTIMIMCRRSKKSPHTCKSGGEGGSPPSHEPQTRETTANISQIGVSVVRSK